MLFRARSPVLGSLKFLPSLPRSTVYKTNSTMLGTWFVVSFALLWITRLRALRQRLFPSVPKFPLRAGIDPSHGIDET